MLIRFGGVMENGSPYSCTITGAIAWFAFGRPRARDDADGRRPPRSIGRSGTVTQAAPKRSIAPDDDPDFLRRLGEQMRRNPPDDPVR